MEMILNKIPLNFARMIFIIMYFKNILFEGMLTTSTEFHK